MTIAFMHQSRLLAAISVGLLLCSSLGAQNIPGDTTRPTLRPLYSWSSAAPHAPRIGAAYEPERERLRLDIGGTIPLLRSVVSKQSEGRIEAEIGADFFTWSRLRSEESFKFPVEAVDYYFGLYATASDAWLFGDHPERSWRVVPTFRIAHISAHLVDGDTLFGTASDPFVYSREFVELLGEIEWRSEDRDLLIRSGLGARALFHAIPDVDNAVSPFLWIDGSYRPSSALPLTLQAGYWLRLDNEFSSQLGTLIEHRLRLAVLLAGVDQAGVSIETGYHRGRSVYGHYLLEEIATWSFGFRIAI